MSRAAYMREWRRQKRLQKLGLEDPNDVTVSIHPTDGEASEYRAKDTPSMIGLLVERVAFLENEVARLKLELAARPDYTVENIHRVAEDFERRANELDASFRQFRPVPKTGKK